ncbi:SGNH/GDSL hydrolase family protein [Promicromonospora iranensis]|uniref:Lysophospholipase L1-like esterase n=1 Tax=Promicromonospora iranensis TaxID=1105144 RepID=A0ABU2CV89_9MICO|nr:SGNH/GDSL hydrolase family protein [Promicromonospora iranensis]MDR7385257.1 lysophospholipase L1-like esterase [Promicromonospora iranensis]
MKRWLVGGGIVAGVMAAFVVAVVVGMVAGGGGMTVGDGGGQPAATSTRGPTPTPSVAPTPTPTPSPTPVPSAENAEQAAGRTAERASGAKPPVALFVGDSYTVGQRASAPSKRWSTIVAREMGWTERNVADGGTGFVSRYPDQDRLSYAEQLRSVGPRGIDLVVIAGGQNDFPELRETPARVFRAVADTYELAARRFPDAEIIAVGPSTPWEIGLEARALDSAVRAAAERHGATYVSMLDPDVVRDRYIDADGTHVNDRGYAAISRRVVSQIS